MKDRRAAINPRFVGLFQVPPFVGGAILAPPLRSRKLSHVAENGKRHRKARDGNSLNHTCFLKIEVMGQVTERSKVNSGLFTMALAETR